MPGGTFSKLKHIFIFIDIKQIILKKVKALYTLLRWDVSFNLFQNRTLEPLLSFTWFIFTHAYMRAH